MLRGYWTQFTTGDQGTLEVTLDRTTPGGFAGTVVIKGSPDCKKPVAVSGVRTIDSFEFESVGEEACGQSHGKLRVKVRKKADNRYEGTYRFTITRFEIYYTGGEFTLEREIPATAPATPKR